MSEKLIKKVIGNKPYVVVPAGINFTLVPEMAYLLPMADEEQVIFFKSSYGRDKQVAILGESVQLKRINEIDELINKCVLIPALSINRKKRGIDDLLDVIEVLRSDNGCPWDQEQTIYTLRKSLLEEAYEVVDAVNNGSKEDIAEELGDVLLQVVFYASIGKSEGWFDFLDVVAGITEKMIRRHPHVFSTAVVENTDDVMIQWDEIKKMEKPRDNSLLGKLPQGMSALILADKIQDRARKAGFDWDSIDGAWDKVSEELKELQEAIKTGDIKAIEDEFGDLLFACVNISRFLDVDVDAENALLGTCGKFVSRFHCMEQIAHKLGLDFKSMDLISLDKLWDEAKDQENKL